MPETPGQIAHAAYVAAEHGGPVPPGRVATRWRCLLPSEQRGWEAAAQAVQHDVLRYVRAVIRHWNEFGPGYGFVEHMNALETWLEAHRHEGIPHA